ncbi:MAG: dockerin type I domain-containing protein, partial [Candidatus Levybacteria bacterium]|nr:dockerin type I domain-containing protein [Candidatus Levybacteria bacterium]
SADLILYNLTTSSPVVGAPTTQVFNRIYVTGKQYSANISLTNLPQDKYFIVVRKDSMIAKAAFTVSSTTGTITVPTTILVFGDLNNDNNIDTLDYNMFKGCWNNKVATGSCASSDFDKNKTIDQIDFNTFIRGWATWNKEGK